METPSTLAARCRRYTRGHPDTSRLQRLPPGAPRPMSKTTPAAYDPSAKQKSQAKTSRIPIKVVPAEVLKKPDWIRVKAGSPSTRFYEIKQILREHQLHTVCEEASLPEHRRMLRQGHGHLHDHGRQVHAPLPVLRRRPRPARPAGRRASRENLARDDRGAEAEVRGHHQRRPRRPARRRRRPLRRLHPQDARAVAADHGSRSWCPTSAAATTARWTS